MQLGETIATYDVGLALRGENGKFEITSPAGEIYHVTCKPNPSILNLERSGNKTDPQPFLIRKVAEPVSVEQEKGTTTEIAESGTQTRSLRTPFLIENQGADAKPSSQGDLAAAFGSDPQDSAHNEEANLELLYLESDERTEQPFACIYLKSGPQDRTVKGGRLITFRCASFNQLDAEIRRLHAQLDDIRSRARKKFYKAQAIAAGA